MITRGLLREHPSAVLVAKRTVDLATVLAGALLAHQSLFGAESMQPSFREACVLGMLLSLIFFQYFGLYRPWRGQALVTELAAVGSAWIGAFVTLAGIVWVTGGTSHLVPDFAMSWFAITFAMLAASRCGLHAGLRWLRSHGVNQRRVVLAVASDLGIRVANRLHEIPWTGLTVVGFFDDRDASRIGDHGKTPLLGPISAMRDYVHTHKIDQVWLALPFRAETRLRHLLHELRHSTVDIRMVPDLFEFFLLNQSLTEVGGIPVVNVAASPMEGFNEIVKAIEDRLLGLTILLLMLPLLAVIAFAVRLSSPGPILFKQRRHGWNGQIIEMWKFRTMRMHEEQEKGKITLASRGDARITKVGAFLRRTSLDELPQFFNVLQGTMSIVGPRPHPLEIDEAFKESVDRYMLRHKVKPGITGWAQVNGFRGALDTPEKMELRVRHDLYYIEHWSLAFDLRIIFLTLFRGFVHENAY